LGAQPPERELIDEYCLMVAPSVQGAGKRLFGAGLPPAIEHVQARPLALGSEILHSRLK
jgi:dihydrofolate reductase